MKRRKSFSVAAGLALALCLLLPGSAVLAGGGGQGGGQNQAFQLLAATPADGSKDLPLDTKFELQFNKNVVNIAVKDINSEAITLWLEGQEVPVELEMADDQIDRERRDFITVVPQGGLKAGKEYVLKLAATLQAKSGDILAAALELKYSTAGASSAAAPETTAAATAAPTTAASATTAATTVAATTAAPATTAASSGASSAASSLTEAPTSAANTAAQSSGTSGSALYYVLAAAGIAGLSFLLYRKRRK